MLRQSKVAMKAESIIGLRCSRHLHFPGVSRETQGFVPCFSGWELCFTDKDPALDPFESPPLLIKRNTLYVSQIILKLSNSEFAFHWFFFGSIGFRHRIHFSLTSVLFGLHLRIFSVLCWWVHIYHNTSRVPQPHTEATNTRHSSNSLAH